MRAERLIILGQWLVNANRYGKEIRMSEELLVRHCSPALAGMKTGSLFTCSYKGEDEMRDALRRFNRMLGKKGLRLLPRLSAGGCVRIHRKQSARV